MQKIEPGAPESQSADPTAANLAQLRALFPELVTEGPNGPAVNLDVLKALVGDATVTDAEEKYGLNWHGKRAARQLALTPSTGTLRPCPDESVDWDTTKNLMIEGDNLEVLKLLQKSYAGKVKLIYIDPPYNTGTDFVYRDDYRDNLRNYQRLTNQVDEIGSPLMSNPETGGRFHTQWLNMMYPRLKIAYTFLSKDGFIFVNIDETESANLRHLLDEIFGPENCAAVIVWKKGSGSSDSDFSFTHDQILVYRKSEQAELGRVSQGESQLASYQNPDNDHRGEWTSSDYTSKWTKEERPNLWYPIRNPNTGVDCWPPEQRTWAYGLEETKKNIEQALLYWGKSGGNERPRYKRFKTSTGGLRVPRSVWDGVGTNEQGTSTFRSLGFAKSDFEHPKPVELIREVLRVGAPRGGLVMDFFAGSGTFGHAVMEHAAETSLSYRLILIQLPQALERSNFRTLSDVTKERLRRAAKRIAEVGGETAGDLGFRVFKLDTSNIRAWNPASEEMKATLLDHAEHLLPGRTDEDVLAELLLKLGLDLCVPKQARSVGDKPLRSIAGGVLITCLAAHIEATEVESLAQSIIAWHKELSPAGDTTCVFRDSAFADDVAKCNMAAILEQNGIANVRSL
jgi:adenine-specific DNA-methyltransferase